MGDGIGPGRRAFQPLQFLEKGVLVEDVHQRRHLLDGAGRDMGVDQLLNLRLVLLEIDDFGIAPADRRPQLHEERQVLAVLRDPGIGRLLHEPGRGQGDGERAAEIPQALVEPLAEGGVGQFPFVLFLVLLVLDVLEQIEQVRMATRQLVDLLGHIGQRRLQIGLVVFLHLAVQVECLVQVLQDAPIVDDVAEVLAVAEPVHAGDGLQ